MEEVCPEAARALELAGVTPDELGAFVPHQANLRMIELMVERLGLTGRTAVARDVEHSGNTSAASVPLALETLLSRRGAQWRLRPAGRLRRGAQLRRTGGAAAVTNPPTAVTTHRPAARHPRHGRTPPSSARRWPGWPPVWSW
ncbi:3-oxoacyl-[acyl-carrier-protein] synthase III C-terminal domain-containing protein [Streptomyces thermocarboxydus]